MASTSKCALCSRTGVSAQGLSEYDGTRFDCTTCGRYEISNLIVSVGLDNYTDSQGVQLGPLRHLISGLTRQASDSGNLIKITEDSVATLRQSMPMPTTLDCLDRALIFVSEVQIRADKEIQTFFDNDYPRAFAKDGDEFRFLLQTLVDQGLLYSRGTPGNDGFYRLNPEGWVRVEQIKKVQIDSDQAFVAMWFDDKLLDAWEKGFEPALTATGFKPLRVDLAEYNGKIDDFIVAQIRRSGLVVADFTGHRGGVYFEAGLAMGIGINWIFTCHNSGKDELHFDTRQYNHIFWEDPEDLKTQLQRRIVASIPGTTIKGPL